MFSDTVPLKADVPEKSGQSVEIDPTLLLVKEQILKGGDDHTIVAKTIVVQADLRADTIANLGLKELIGTATTDFSGSPGNRKFNIDRGQQSLNGGLLKNGQVYSTTGALVLLKNLLDICRN